MFRKLVSNLAFSPALVGQLGFYAKRLRKEETTRRIGLIFTALALVVQSFSVFSPPESANAANGNDMISGGVTTKEALLGNYDSNTNNLKDFYTSLGITRAEIAATTVSSINSHSTPAYSYGMHPRFSAAQGEGQYNVKTSSGSNRTFYYRPLKLSDTKSYTIRNGSTYKVFIGHSAKFGWFGILQLCGNFVSKQVPPAPVCPTGTTGTYPNCAPPPVKPTPVARCESLKISKLVDNYQLDATASTQGGATISSYIYTIKKDGQIVHTKTITSTSNTNTYVYTQKDKGSYTVELTVKTSVGDQTGPNCVKSFNIPAPEMCPQNPSLPKASPDCQPCPGDSTIWIKDEKCAAQVVQTKTANNATQNNADATTVTAKASDRIVYTLTLTNNGKAPADITPEEDLTDVAEYAEVIDMGGGAYNSVAKKLTWPTITLKPGEKQTRMFTVKIADTIPAMGTGASERTSYDCRIDNTFGNTISIGIDCPVQKQVVEQTVAELPHTGPRENMIFAGIVFAIVAYFYARSRQMKKEVRLIRRDLNAGTI